MPDLSVSLCCPTYLGSKKIFKKGGIDRRGRMIYKRMKTLSELWPMQIQLNTRNLHWRQNPVGNHMLKFNNRNTRTKRETCSELIIKTAEWRQWRRSGVFVNFEHISHLTLLFLLLTLSRQMPAGKFSIRRSWVINKIYVARTLKSC